MPDDAPQPADKRNRFILDRPTGRVLRARDALICVFVAVIALLLVEGASIRNSGNKMDAGIQRSVVLAVGHPAGWLADKLPLADIAHDLTASLSPDDDLSGGPGGFNSAPVGGGPVQAAGGGAAAPITTDAFDPVTLGAPPNRLPELEKLLVTGDSLAQPLDVQLARMLAGDGVVTTRDAHLGTGISKTDLVDWGLLSTKQVKDGAPDAVVMFMGANEGFPFPGGTGGKKIECCGPEWAATYATRARTMMNTYRRDGDARVYWLTLPAPRDAARQKIAKAVNAAIAVAAQPFASQVRVLDMNAVFTPGGAFRAAMDVDGRQTLVRRQDGIHLNDAGASVATKIVAARIKQDFEKLG
jgi:lysophospholipase L1-like esterase